MNPHPCLTPRNSTDCEAYNCPQEHFGEVMPSLVGLYPMLVDITAVDHGVEAPRRFEVLYHFLNPVNYQYLRVGVWCFSNATPSLPTVTHLWPAADWHEREVYDLMGVTFEGHPNMKRILMWEDYPYHPLRKDFPLAGLPAELPGEDIADEVTAKVGAAPMAGGPFVATEGKTMSKREPQGRDQSWNEGKEKK